MSNLFIAEAVGFCQSGNGISHGDYLIIDAEKKPVPGDVCLCVVPYANGGKPWLKEYLGRFGNTHCVGTRYADHSNGMEKVFFSTNILGTVVKVLTSKNYLPRTESTDAEIKGNISAVYLDMSAP